MLQEKFQAWRHRRTLPQFELKFLCNFWRLNELKPSASTPTLPTTQLSIKLTFSLRLTKESSRGRRQRLELEARCTWGHFSFSPTSFQKKKNWWIFLRISMGIWPAHELENHLMIRFTMEKIFWWKDKRWKKMKKQEVIHNNYTWKSFCCCFNLHLLMTFSWFIESFLYMCFVCVCSAIWYTYWPNIMLCLSLIGSMSMIWNQQGPGSVVWWCRKHLRKLTKWPIWIH